MIKKSVKIVKRSKFGAVDGFVYVVAAANGHTIAQMDIYGKGGLAHAQLIKNAINKMLA